MEARKSAGREIYRRLRAYAGAHGIKKTMVVILTRLKIRTYIDKMRSRISPRGNVDNFEILVALSIIQKELREIKVLIDKDRRG